MANQDLNDFSEIDRLVNSFGNIGQIGFSHPNWDPAIFSLGFFELRWYSLAYLAGILLGWLLIMHLNKKHNGNYLSQNNIDSLPLWMVLSIVLGGRFGYVVFYNLEFYLNNLGEILKVWNGGMSFHGGAIGVTLGVFLFCKFKKLHFLKVTDLIAIAAPIGLFFGRIANFINKELIGKVTDVSWAVNYEGVEFPRHPSQLYEAATEGLLLFIILVIVATKFKGLHKTGLCSGIFLLGYGLARAFCEIFREPDEQIGYLFDAISMGQALSIPMMLVGFFLILLGLENSKRNKEPLKDGKKDIK